MQNLQHYTDMVVSLVVQYGPKLTLAITTYIVGAWLIKKLVVFVDRGLEKSKTDVSLRGFLKSLITVGLKLLLIISVVTMLGVETTSLIAILGAAGLAVGLALQGSLSNFAGGVLILFFKPFEVGDYIRTNDYEGTVEEIQIFTTILRTLDNRRIIIPNGILSNEILTNVYKNGKIRVEHKFGIGYGDDIDKAREVILDVVKKTDGVLSDPTPVVHVSGHGDNAVELTLWTWVHNDNHWGVYFGLYEDVKKAFDANGITIPYPQRDVHLYQANASA